MRRNSSIRHRKVVGSTFTRSLHWKCSINSPRYSIVDFRRTRSMRVDPRTLSIRACGRRCLAEDGVIRRKVLMICIRKALIQMNFSSRSSSPRSNSLGCAALPVPRPSASLTYFAPWRIGLSPLLGQSPFGPAKGRARVLSNRSNAVYSRVIIITVILRLTMNSGSWGCAGR
jgi:hypothetical protein